MNVVVFGVKRNVRFRILDFAPYRKAHISTGTHWNSKTYLEIKWTSINSLNINLQLCAAQKWQCLLCILRATPLWFPTNKLFNRLRAFRRDKFSSWNFSNAPKKNNNANKTKKKHIPNTTIGCRFNAKPCFASEPVEISFISQKNTRRCEGEGWNGLLQVCHTV